MFEIVEHEFKVMRGTMESGPCAIRGTKHHRYLHSDGNTHITCEWWPTREQAQAVLDKYQPEHVWEHGDVFRNGNGTMMYLYPRHGRKSMVWLSPRLCAVCSLVEYREDCVFLFNIKDKLPC